MVRPTFALPLAAALAVGAKHPEWNLKQFRSLVSFGDSYTDDSRLVYFIENNNTVPPPGYANPVNYDAADGGRPWPDYVAQYTGIKRYNYAVSGATCSAALIPAQTLNDSAGVVDFPDVSTYEVPDYLAETNYTSPATGKPFLDVSPHATVYSIWIGTNDVGVEGFISNKQAPGANLTTYLDCVYAQVQRLYDSGARYFVLMNLAPLQLSPLYGFPDAGGVTASEYWPDKPNATDVAFRMTEQVATVNSIYEYRTQSEVLVQRKYPGANFAVYNMEKLITDIYNNPSQYLNGSAPLSVTIPENKCTTEKVCVRSDNPDSYLWYDDLHPSEQTERIVAREFVNVMSGSSQFANYYSCS